MTTNPHPITTMHFHHPPPPPPVHHHHSMSTKRPTNLRLFSLLQPFVMLFVISLFFLFVGIASIFIVHILIAGRWYRHSHSHRRSYQHLSLDDKFDSGLSHDQIQKLPCSDYRSVLDSVSTRDCAVCLEGFRGGETFRILPLCRHVFHANCVGVWLRKASACPICRREVVESKDYN